MRLLAAISCISACALLAAPAAAPAKPHKPHYLTPPGNSGITQYSEVVPSSNGNTPTGGVSTSPHKPLPPAAARALAGPGKARQQLSNFVAATAPTSVASSGSSSRSRSRGRHAVSAASAQAPSGASGLTSLARALVGHGGGMGFVLPLLLGVALASAVFIGLRRRARF